MRITAVIVTYNSAEVVSAALHSLAGAAEVTSCIVVDNGSSDATAFVVKSQFPDVDFIANDENHGFGAACNQALERVTTEAVLFLNPDARISASAVQELVAALDDNPNVAGTGPAMKEHGFFPLGMFWRLMPWRKKRLLQQKARCIPVSFLSGGIALWRTQYLQALGGFDPDFFLFYEDNDLSLRARQAGYELLLVTGLDVEHQVGAASAQTEAVKRIKLFHSARSALRYKLKHAGRLQAALLVRCMVFRAFVHMLVARSKGARPATTEQERWQQLQKEVENLWQAGQASQEKLWRQAQEKQEKILSSMQAKQEKIWRNTHKQHTKIWQRNERLKQAESTLSAAEEFLDEKLK